MKNIKKKKKNENKLSKNYQPNKTKILFPAFSVIFMYKRIKEFSNIKICYLCKKVPTKGEKKVKNNKLKSEKNLNKH